MCSTACLACSVFVHSRSGAVDGLVRFACSYPHSCAVEFVQRVAPHTFAVELVLRAACMFMLALHRIAVVLLTSCV